MLFLRVRGECVCSKLCDRGHLTHGLTVTSESCGLLISSLIQTVSRVAASQARQLRGAARPDVNAPERA